jgi:signal transduction histidine kinase
LDSIINTTQSLLKDDKRVLTPDHRAGIEGIWRSVTILDGLVSDILDLVAVDAGQLTLELNTVDIIPLLISVMALVRERAREFRVHMDLDCPTDVGWIVADERRLKQVLFTLLNDLIVTTPASEHLLIKVLRLGKDICFTVEGKRNPSSNLPVEYSFGLRRALMQRIVQMHGGAIETNAVDQQMASVTVRIPTGLASRM